MRAALDIIADALTPMLDPEHAPAIAQTIMRDLDAGGYVVLETATRDRLKRACEAVRKDCRDPDTDAAVSPTTGELIEQALSAAGPRS